MNDIIDIYEPIYDSPNYLLLAVIILLITILFIITYFLLRRLRKKSVITLETKYKDSLDQLLFLKGNLGKLQSKEFLKKANEILCNYLSFQYSDNYNSLTSNELLHKLSIESVDNQYIKVFFTNKNDLVLYGNDQLENSDREEHLKKYGELINDLYRSTLDD